MTTSLCPESFREIGEEEQVKINGGILPFLIGVGIAAVAEIITDWDNFKNGLTGRPEEKK